MKFDSLKRTEQKDGNRIQVHYYLLLDGYHFSISMKTANEMIERFELAEQPTKVENFALAAPVKSIIYYQK